GRTPWPSQRFPGVRAFRATPEKLEKVVPGFPEERKPNLAVGPGQGQEITLTGPKRAEMMRFRPCGAGLKPIWGLRRAQRRAAAPGRLPVQSGVETGYLRRRMYPTIITLVSVASPAQPAGGRGMTWAFTNTSM